MQTAEKTKEELAAEVAHLRQRVAELEASERERKQVDEALKRNEQEKAVLFDSISEHVVYQDTRMRVLWTNRAAGESVGVDPQQLVGRHCYEIWQQRSKPCVGCPVVKARKSGQHQEAEMISPDGRVWFIRGYPVRDIKGNIIGAVEVTLEITESKQVEEALRKSEEKYRTVVELSPDGIAVASKGRHVFANKSLAEIFGVSDPNELLGKPLMDYIHPDYRKVVKERLDRQTKRGELVPLIEEKMLRADGTVIHTEVAAAPLKYEGEQAILAVIRDITERKKAEEALHESEERFRSLVETTSDWIWSVDQDGIYTYVSPRIKDLLGYEPDEIIGKTPFDLMPPDEAERVGIIFGEIIASHKPIKSLENINLHKDGSTVLLETSGVPIFDSKGSFKGYQGIDRDITERKRMKQELRQSEESFRRVVETMEVGLGAIDQNGVFTYVNEYFSKMLGYSIDEMIRRSTFDFFYDEKQRQTQQEVLAKRRAGMRDPTPYEVAWENKDGQIVYSILSPTPIFDADGRYTGSFAIHTDITERKRMEQDLRESEERFRALFEGAPDAIFLADPESGRILDANPAASHLLLRSHEEIIGLHQSQLHPLHMEKYVREKFTEHLEQSRRKTQVHPIESAIIRSDGSEIPVEVLSQIVHIHGKDIIQGTFRDTTERKQAEDALRNSEERYRFLFENSQTINMLIGTDGKILDINESAAESLGYKKKSLIGKKVLEFVIPDQREIVAQQLALELSGDYTPPLEIDIIIPKGTRTLLFTKGHATLFEKGELTGILLSAVDITERKKAENELKIKNNAIVSSTTAIAIGEFGGNLTYVNPMFLKMWGYDDVKEVLGKPAVNFWLTKEKAQDIIEALFKGEPVAGELKAKRKDGSLFDVQLSSSLVTDDTGKPISMMASFVDITERKQAEEKLRVSEERFRTICETAQDFIALKDRDCKFTYVNPSMEKVFGIPASKLIGRTSEAIFGKDRSAYIVEEDLRVLNGEIIDEEHPSPVKGSSAVHHIIKVPIRNSAGEIIGLCNIGRDITERKRMEEALRESEERFRTIVEQAAEAIIAHDLDGQVLLVNSLACAYTGYPQENLLSMNVLDIDHEIIEKEHKKRYWEKLQVGEHAKVEATHIRKDGSTYAAEVYLVKIMFKGQPIILCLARDITERKQMEEALRKSEEKYRLLVNNIDLGINLIDADYSILMANASVGKRCKKSLSEIIGKKCFQVFENRDTVCPDCPGVQTIATGQPAVTEHEEVRDDQGHFYVMLQAFPHFGQDGRVIGFTEIAEDITDRKQAEKALQESESRFRLLVEHSVDAFILHDIGGKIIDVNQHTCDSLGYTREELLGLYVDDIDQNVRVGKHIEKWKQMVPGEPITLEGVHKRKDGTTFPVEVRLGVFESDGRKLMLGLVRNVSERKQAEETLHEREAFNYALFHYNPVETIVVDLEGRVTAFNLAKEKSGDRLPSIGDRMYKDYAGKHEIDMRTELMKCIRSGASKEFPERKYGDKYLNITVSPFSQGAIIISEDITERKHAEEALRESEQFSSSLLNDSPNPIIVINPDTSLRYVNPALEKLTGFSGAELLARKAPYPWWREEIISETTRGLKRAMQQGARRIEKHFQTKNKEPFWVEITAEPVMHDGKVRYLLTNWIDITERKHAEELLQKERDTFFSILQKAPYGVMVSDKDENHTFVNFAFTSITGYTIHDIPTLHDWFRLAYPDPRYRNMVSKILRQDIAQWEADEKFRETYGRVFTRSFSVVCKDGTAKEIEFRRTPIADEGMFIMLSDITDRQRMHALLETAAGEWRTTFDAISDAVCLLDPHGKIIRCNNAMLKLMGKPFSQITNHHCWEVMHGVSEAPHSCPIELAGKTHHRETEVMFKDSHWFNIAVDPLLDEDGNFIGGVHIMSDITDRMRIQNELQDSREQLRNLTVYLQSVREQERTNIAREIHDELAQALTALKMDLSWLDHRLPSDAGSLIEKTKSMNNLIDSTIHTVKRISAELRPGILDDLGLVAAIEWQAEEFQNRTGISCNITVDPQDLTVDQDRSTAIFRIFQETLTNVARHARATRVTVSLKARAGRLTLRVRDNGTGITEEQVSAPQSFGLIGIRERVHPWGGKVSIKGIPGKGTAVQVTVELARSKNDKEKIESIGSPS